MGVKATVRDGRLRVDEATDLPEGTVLDLVIDDEGDDLGDEERARLHAALRKSLQQAEDGYVSPGEEILEELRRRS